MAIKLVRICDAIRWLWNWLERAVGKFFQRIRQQRRPHQRKPVMQRARGFVSSNRCVLFGQDATGVQSLIHFHNADTRLSIAGDNGALDRCRAAPPRQQGRMHVETTELWCFKNFTRQDQTIGNNDRSIEA